MQAGIHVYVVLLHVDLIHRTSIYRDVHLPVGSRVQYCGSLTAIVDRRLIPGQRWQFLNLSRLGSL